MSWATNYGNYGCVDEGCIPDFDEVFTESKYVGESISETVRSLFDECFAGNDNKEEYWEDFVDYCRECI